MKQYESSIQNNNIKKRKKKDKIKKRKDTDDVRERAWMREIFIFIYLLFASFSDLRKSDSRFSSRLKAKLIHAARATRGYQNHGVSSNSTR